LSKYLLKNCNHLMFIETKRHVDTVHENFNVVIFLQQNMCYAKLNGSKWDGPRSGVEVWVSLACQQFPNRSFGPTQAKHSLA